MRIAAAGGSGVVGRHVVEVARHRGHEVVVLARSTGTDLTTGVGLAARLADVDAVVDVASTVTQRRDRAEQFFGSVTSTLLGAEARARVAHHVVLSIVGIDRVPGAAGRRMRGNGLLPSAPGPRGSRTFDAWLRARTRTATSE